MFSPTNPLFHQRLWPLELPLVVLLCKQDTEGYDIRMDWLAQWVHPICTLYSVYNPYVVKHTWWSSQMSGQTQKPVNYYLDIKHGTTTLIAGWWSIFLRASSRKKWTNLHQSGWRSMASLLLRLQHWAYTRMPVLRVRAVRGFRALAMSTAGNQAGKS